MMDFALDTAKIDKLLHRNTAATRAEIGDPATASAIQAVVATVDEIVYRRSFGRVDLETADAKSVGDETVFDVASLTKSIVGATLAMQAVDEGLVDWDTPIAEIYEPWEKRRDEPSRQVTFAQILNHTSGLPAWRKFYLEYPLDPTPEQARKTGQSVLDTIVTTPLEGAPGTVHAYSDLGYLLLAKLLEVLFGRDLHRLARRRIFEPLGMQNTTYVDGQFGPDRLDEAVVTEDCSLRGRVIRGTVHDENTNIIGGVSTHAGVFSTATDIARFAQHLLAIDAGEAVDAPIVSREVLRHGWSAEAGSSVGSHRAGWDTPSGEKSSAGRGFSRDHSVGHLGFTGTSLWIERRCGIISVLLTNRVYPTRDNDRIKALRVAFQEAVLPVS